RTSTRTGRCGAAGLEVPRCDRSRSTTSRSGNTRAIVTTTVMDRTRAIGTTTNLFRTTVDRPVPATSPLHETVTPLNCPTTTGDTTRMRSTMMRTRRRIPATRTTKTRTTTRCTRAATAATLRKRHPAGPYHLRTRVTVATPCSRRWTLTRRWLHGDTTVMVRSGKVGFKNSSLFR
ncbi:hypothetical protein PENTCL1PPCAC_23919, partial [Pristionchus entomophagus]